MKKKRLELREKERESALKWDGFNIFIPGKELSQFITVLHCTHPHILFLTTKHRGLGSCVSSWQGTTGEDKQSERERGRNNTWAVVMTNAYCS